MSWRKRDIHVGGMKTYTHSSCVSSCDHPSLHSTRVNRLLRAWTLASGSICSRSGDEVVHSSPKCTRIFHHHRTSARATVLVTAVLVRRMHAFHTLVRRVARRGGSHTRVPSCNSHASIRARLVVRFSAPPKPCHYVSPDLPSRHRCDPRPRTIHRSNRSPTVSPTRCLCRRGRSSSAVLVRSPSFRSAGGGCTSHAFDTRSNGRVARASRRALDGACSFARRFGDGEVRRWITWQSRKCRSWCGGVRPQREQGARKGSWRGRR